MSTYFWYFPKDHCFVLHSYHLYARTLDARACAHQLDFPKNPKNNPQTNRGTLEGPETSVLEGLTRRIQFCRVYPFCTLFLHVKKQEPKNRSHKNIHSRFGFSLPRAFCTWSRSCRSPFVVQGLIFCVRIPGGRVQESSYMFNLDRIPLGLDHWWLLR